LGSDILLGLLKVPPPKTNSENYEIKPHTHKRLEDIKVPEVADFQNELLFQDFMLETWNKLDICRKQIFSGLGVLVLPMLPPRC